MSEAPQLDPQHNSQQALALLLTKLKELHQRKQTAAKALRDLEKDYNKQAQQVLNLLNELGLETAKAGGVTVAITEQKFPGVTKDENDEPRWQEAFQWIAETDNWHMLRKQLNIAPCVELQKLDELPDFIQIFTKRGLSNPR